FLGLGAKENLRFSSHAGAFADFVSEEKIYRRNILPIAAGVDHAAA
ncbi:protein-glutamate O-methyltransferase CheR, partial [Escherichia coli]|nr:protein-glutamate O-methyltransferase CheR [Escherichia coli]